MGTYCLRSTVACVVWLIGVALPGCGKPTMTVEVADSGQLAGKDTTLAACFQACAARAAGSGCKAPSTLPSGNPCAGPCAFMIAQAEADQCLTQQTSLWQCEAKLQFHCSAADSTPEATNPDACKPEQAALAACTDVSPTGGGAPREVLAACDEYCLAKAKACQPGATTAEANCSAACVTSFGTGATAKCDSEVKAAIECQAHLPWTCPAGVPQPPACVPDLAALAACKALTQPGDPAALEQACVAMCDGIAQELQCKTYAEGPCKQACADDTKKIKAECVPQAVALWACGTTGTYTCTATSALNDACSAQAKALNDCQSPGQLCEPLSIACEASAVVQCNAAGSAKAVVVDCAKTGKLCLDSMCVATTEVCTGSGPYCSAGHAKVCKNGHVVESQACEAGTTCESGQCVSPPCTGSAAKCSADGKQSKLCVAGQWTTTDCMVDPKCGTSNGCINGVCSTVVYPKGTPCGEGCVSSSCDGKGACTPGQPDCDDGIPCTLDACVSNSYCLHVQTEEKCVNLLDCSTTACTAGVGCSTTKQPAWTKCTGKMIGSACFETSATSGSPTWVAAEQFCLLHGGQLATFASKAEFDAVMAGLEHAPDIAYAIGLQRTDTGWVGPQGQAPGYVDPALLASPPQGGGYAVVLPDDSWAASPQVFATGKFKVRDLCRFSMDWTCDDGNTCTVGETCQDGKCTSGKALSCDDKNQCTVDDCFAGTGCAITNAAASMACDDGNFCTGGDVCTGAGACQAGSPIVCDDNNPCTTDACSASASQPCVYTPVPDGTTCTDDSQCTVGDKCVAKACVPGPAVSCAQGGPCVTTLCDAIVGCTAVPIAAAAATSCGAGMVCDGAGDCAATSQAGPAGMVFVPATKFWMGCNPASDPMCTKYPTESPQHEVQMSAYWIDAKEVSTQDYALCVADGTCTPPAPYSTCFGSHWDSTKNAPEQGDENRPVNCVKWANAHKYCKWRAWQTDPANADKYSLPTEAQWELAARGDCAKNGANSANACKLAMRTYPWGNFAPTCTVSAFFDAKPNGCGPFKAAGVGTLPAGVSPYGAFDMAGNVAEWVEDNYSDAAYANSGPGPDPAVINSATVYVVRGGSYANFADGVRAGARKMGYNWDSFKDLGFRCARSSK